MKNYRIVRIAGIHYPGIFSELWSRHPSFQDLTYSEQQEALFEGSYTYGNGLSRGMAALGHDAHEIVYDLDEMQKKWAEERYVYYDQNQARLAILLAQIAFIRPDVLYFQDVYSMPLVLRRRLHTIFPFLKLVVVFRGYPGGSPQHLAHELSFADVILAGSPILVKKLDGLGLKAYNIYHGFDQSIMTRLYGDRPESADSKYGFTFLGSTGSAGGPHEKRYLALKELMLRTPLELWADVAPSEANGPQTVPMSESARQGLRAICKRLIEPLSPETLRKILDVRLLPHKLRNLTTQVLLEKEGKFTPPPRPVVAKNLSELFPDRVHKPVFGLNNYRILKESTVTFNIHSDAAQGTVDNMRMFQSTGVGACLLTDSGTNMADLFEEDSEVVTYRSVEECVEKANYLLDHPDAAARIGEAGQRRTLRDHDVTNRCVQIDDIVQKRI